MHDRIIALKDWQNCYNWPCEQDISIRARFLSKTSQIHPYMTEFWPFKIGNILIIYLVNTIKTSFICHISFKRRWGCRPITTLLLILNYHILIIGNFFTLGYCIFLKLTICTVTLRLCNIYWLVENDRVHVKLERGQYEQTNMTWSWHSQQFLL